MNLTTRIEMFLIPLIAALAMTPNEGLSLAQEVTPPDTALLHETTSSVGSVQILNSEGIIISSFTSLDEAIQNLPPESGYTIKLGSGHYTISEPLRLPEGVNLIGDGSENTRITSTFHSTVTGSFPPSYFAIQLVSSSPSPGEQTLEGFTLDGDNWQVQGGIYVKRRNAITLQNLVIENFSWSGIWIEMVEDVTIHNCDVLESSWGNSAYASGSVAVGNAKNVLIDQLTIVSTNLGGGTNGIGYGIKATFSNAKDRLWDKVTIQNSTIDILPDGSWNNGQAPNISIESHQTMIRNCRITNNILYNNISTVGEADGTTPSMRIDNNWIQLKLSTSGNYGLEMSTPNMTIEHNYFGGAMERAIADWVPNEPLHNIQINHNIFYGNLGDTLIYLKSPTPGLLFANNVYAKDTRGGGARILYFDAGNSEDVILANNLFSMNPRSAREDLIILNSGASLSNLSVNNNWFHRIATDTSVGTWEGNVFATEGPPVQKTGELWEEYFEPLPGSSIVDAGVDVGLAYIGSAPDIGCRELNHWRLFPVDSSGWADTGAWMAYIYVNEDPWLWSASLNQWFYSPGPTNWIYIPRY